MMNLFFSHPQLSYILLLMVSLSFLFNQVMVKQKQLIHLLFALFCSSLSMMCIQKLSAPSIGIYQYVIGLGTCATCNVVWLISRALFRKQNALGPSHIFVALLIAFLLMINQAWHLAEQTTGFNYVSDSMMSTIKTSLNESLNLLSSTILLLSFWEAIRGYTTKTKDERKQSLIFAAAFFIAVVNSALLVNLFEQQIINFDLEAWMIMGSASLIIVAIQTLIFMQRSHNTVKQNNPTVQPQALTPEIAITPNIVLTPKLAPASNITSKEDHTLIEKIESLIKDKRIYLQSNIKLLDFAKALDAPEYKISRVIRHYYLSPNFNHFINQHRVQHAKRLFASEEAKDWSILVIALECGFSSLVSFNRVFKTLSGEIPSQYRSQSQQTKAL